MTPASSNISVVEPVGPAIAWTKRMLFQPFDLGKWFTIGFCAWLAHLAESGGGGFNFHVPSGGRGGMEREMEQARDFVVQNLYWIIPVVIAILVFSIALGVLFTWVSSRGRFMFLDCVVRDKAVIAEPWSVYAREGNSLFIFRLLLGLGGLLLMLFPIAGIIVSLIGLSQARGGVPGGWIVLLIITVLLAIFLGLVLVLIGKIAKDFVVPIMYLRRCGWVQGWSECTHLLSAHLGTFILYFLFQMVLHIAIGLMVLAAIIITCCIAGCLLALPYIGTVLMLPLLVFLRAYSNLYLAQFGPDYGIFNQNVR